MSTPSERFRVLLNYTGFPFQYYCADKLAQLEGYQVSVEVPFTFPPTDGPRLGVHGEIDILAVAPDAADERLLCFIVECKKTDVKSKNWILLPNRQQSPRWPTFICTSVDPGVGEAGIVTRSVTFPALGYSRGSDYQYCVNGIEAGADLTKSNQNLDQKIYKPLQQVMRGVRAFEGLYPKIVEGVDYFRFDENWPERLYVPVVVTTSNIYLPSFPADKIADGLISSGDLDIGESRKWVTYEFPLPDYLGYHVERGDRGHTTAVAKRTVFIVNHEHIDEFFIKSRQVAMVGEQPFE